MRVAEATIRMAPKARTKVETTRRDTPVTPEARKTVAPAPPFAMAAGTASARPAVPSGAPPARTAPVVVTAAPAPSAPAPASRPALKLEAPPVVEASARPEVADDLAAPAAVAAVVPEDFALRAERLIAEHVPRVAQRAERRVLRVLHVASQAENRWQGGDVLDTARTMQLGADELLPVATVATADARLLDQTAEAAFWGARNAHQALKLQTRAFGADPHDAVVAGNLAFYLLKQRPVRAEVARQLALVALASPDPRHPHGRIDDWTNFAIASALTGRERDARDALFVTLALSSTVDRQCRTALAAVNQYGERLRRPTEAMLARIRTWGRSQESSFCRWPPSWWASVRG